MEFFHAIANIHKTYPQLPEDQIRWAMEQEIDSRLKDLEGTGRRNQYADAVETAHERILFWLKDAPAYAVSFDKPESILAFMTRHRGAAAWAVLAAKCFLDTPVHVTLAGTQRL